MRNARVSPESRPAGRSSSRARSGDTQRPTQATQNGAWEGPLPLLTLQRLVGNQAVARLIGRRGSAGHILVQRMSNEAAAAVAEKHGVTKEDAQTNATQGLRWDPVKKEWAKPKTETVYDDFIGAYDKSNGKMKLTFAQYEVQREKKVATAADYTKPINIDDQGQLKALWGSSAAFDKWATAQRIAKMFTDLKYAVTEPKESTESSSKTPPVLFDVLKHNHIAKFEIHPGGGIHKGPYIRLSTWKGMIKVINTKSNPPYDKLTENAVYADVAIDAPVTTGEPLLV